MSLRKSGSLLILVTAVLMTSGCRKGEPPPQGAASSGVANTESSAPGDTGSATITVFAAASLTDVLADLSGPCEAATGLRLRVSCGASSTMAKQIDAGAKADLYLSADPQWADWLVQRQKTVDAAAGKYRLNLANRLVFVAPLDAGPANLELRRGFPIATAFTGRLAIGDPSHVPAGIKGQKWIDEIGWTDALAGRLAPAADVRAALRLVELGECELGIVYASDAAASDRVRVVPSSGATATSMYDSPAVYYYAALPVGGSPRAADALRWLQGPEAVEIFTVAGFTPIAAPAAPAQGGDHDQP